jgi:hypothetical protein
MYPIEEMPNFVCANLEEFTPWIPGLSYVGTYTKDCYTATVYCQQQAIGIVVVR